MCLIRCDVRIRTARSGGSGVRGWPGHHRRNCQQEPAGDRLRGETDTAPRSTGGTEESSVVHRTRGHCTEGVRSPGTNNRTTEANYRPADTTVPTPGMRPLDVPTTAGQIEAGTEGSQENAQDGRNGRRPTTGTGRYDTGRQTIGTGGQSFEDAVSQCRILSSLGSPDFPPATRRPRTDAYRLHGLFRIGSSSVARLGCSTANGHTRQARQQPRRAVEDAIYIPLPAGSRLRPDYATRPGGQGDRTGRPASFYTTPGSSIWGPQSISHRRMENAGD